MLHNPYEIVKMFEQEIAHYTGAPYAVATDSCTDALLLCCEHLQVEEVTIPARTYLSVPQSILHAGGTVKFDERRWNGIYQLKPYPIYDGAVRVPEIITLFSLNSMGSKLPVPSYTLLPSVWTTLW